MAIDFGFEIPKIEKRFDIPVVDPVEVWYVAGGDVPEGYDGNLVWTEEDPKAGLVWYSKPVMKEELSKYPGLKEKKLEELPV